MDRKHSIVPRVVSVDELLNNLDDYTVLDVRRFVEYKAGHLPRALPCSFSNFIKLVGVALYPADSDSIAEILSRLGVEQGSRIVLYDNFYARHAARTAYTLELLGFKDINLLETTFDEYAKNKNPISVEKPATTTPSSLSLIYDEGLLIDREKISQLIANWDGTAAIIDTRHTSDYSFGHIPYSLNIPWQTFYISKGLFNIEAVRRVAAEKKIENTKQLVFYCEEGTSSSFTMYAFRHAGFLNSHTYLASYPDWLSQLKPTERKK